MPINFEANTYTLTKIFLQDLLKDEPDYPHARELLDLLEAKDPRTIDFILEISDDPLFEPYAAGEVLAELRRNMGLAVSTDDRCLQVLNEYKEKTTDPRVLRALDKGIQFLNLPIGASIEPATWPVDDLLRALESFPGRIDPLADCIRYIANSLE